MALILTLLGAIPLTFMESKTNETRLLSVSTQPFQKVKAAGKYEGNLWSTRYLPSRT